MYFTVFLFYIELSLIDCDKHLLFKTGDGSGRGSILTPEGQQTLSMAKSVLSALVEGISNASVTFEVLQCLRKYKQRFLDLLKVDSTITKEGTKVDLKVESEKSLHDRIEEIQEFLAVKKKTLSFIDMCDLIKPGEN